MMPYYVLYLDPTSRLQKRTPVRETRAEAIRDKELLRVRGVKDAVVATGSYAER